VASVVERLFSKESIMAPLKKLLEPPRTQRTPRKIKGKVENLAKSHPKHKQFAGRL
jgi:hypothetical protein